MNGQPEVAAGWAARVAQLEAELVEARQQADFYREIVENSLSHEIAKQARAAVELERQRDLLQRLIHYVPALVAFHDRDFVYQWVNPTFERLMGVPRERLVGRHLYEVFPEARESFGPVMRRVCETGEPFVAAGFPFNYMLDGEAITTLWDLAFVPVYAPDRTLEGVLGFGVEVSDRHENELLQQARIADLERTAEQKVELMGVVSHELRTPIQVLMGFCTILEQELAGPINDGQREYLARMYAACKALAGLVNDILDLCQAHASGFLIHPRPVQLEEVIEGALADLGPQADLKRQKLAFRASGEIPVMHVDDQRIYQVLLNLVGNAIKFTPEDGTIHVTARPEAEGVRVEVRDDGRGIASGDIPRLFQPFTQLDMGLTREAGGVGMGLAIAKSYIQAHGGEIGVESEPGRGSTFWLTLPASPPQATA